MLKWPEEMEKKCKNWWEVKHTFLLFLINILYCDCKYYMYHALMKVITRGR
jgi:hypothetical protein